MKILFCGTMVPEEIEYQVKDISAAGNRFQNNLILNLEKSGHDVRKCTFLGIPVPREIERRFLQGNAIESSKEIYVLKRNNMIKSIIEYHRYAKSLIDDAEIVMCYNIIYAWLLLPLLARKKKKRCIVILADYSESVSYKSFLGKVYAWLQLWSMRKYETVVGLSGNIRKKLKARQKFVLMEGGIDKAFYDSFYYKPHSEDEPWILLYSGLLSKVTGVDILLQAIEKVKRQDIRLIVTGKGPLEEAVCQAAGKDNRIYYLGHLKYEEYLKQLQEADILINPRNMKLSENQNNFPSKIMDYLAAGKFIVSTRFIGWEKFKENIFFSEVTTKELSDIFSRIMLEDSKEIFYKNRKIASDFLWDRQLQKILKGEDR